MKSTFGGLLIFATGATLGSIITWRLLKTKYEQLYQEEIESYREVAAKRKAKDIEPENPVENTDEISTDEKQYDEVLKKEGYTKYTNTKIEKGDVKKHMVDAPHVISPDEFGELDNYETVSLTYYADGVLTDEYDEIVEDVDDLIGIESLTHFGEYEDDSVFVRNDETRCDYEILKDTRRYSDV